MGGLKVKQMEQNSLIIPSLFMPWNLIRIFFFLPYIGAANNCSKSWKEDFEWGRCTRVNDVRVWDMQGGGHLKGWGNGGSSVYYDPLQLRYTL